MTISFDRSPAEIAAIYRSLRKGREDARDEPEPQIFTTAKWRCDGKRLGASREKAAQFVELLLRNA